MPEKQFAARDIIFNEGDMSDMAYVIRSGAVEILKHGDSGDIRLAELGEGQIFGEMGLFDPRSPRSATARAKTDTVLDVISEAELREMIGQCPPRLIPIIVSVFERLRATNTRVKQKEQATVILESDVDKIVVTPTGDAVDGQFSQMEMPVAHLPFKIGGYPIGGDKSHAAGNHLVLATEGPPLTVSRYHGEVAVVDGKLYFRDLGSRHGTVVNGTVIGRGKGAYSAPLQKGDNDIILGDKKSSAYRIKVSLV